jgi:hypothetical protein
MTLMRKREGERIVRDGWGGDGRVTVREGTKG